MLKFPTLKSLLGDSFNKTKDLNKSRISTNKLKASEIAKQAANNLVDYVTNIATNAVEQTVNVAIGLVATGVNTVLGVVNTIKNISEQFLKLLNDINTSFNDIVESTKNTYNKYSVDITQGVSNFCDSLEEDAIDVVENTEVQNNFIGVVYDKTQNFSNLDIRNIANDSVVKANKIKNIVNDSKQTLEDYAKTSSENKAKEESESNIIPVILEEGIINIKNITVKINTSK